MIFKTIKGNLIFFITILLAIISLFIFFYFPSQFEKLEINSLYDKASVLNKMSAYSVSPALNFNDMDNIKEVASGIIRNKDIIYLIIEDETGVILFSYNKSAANGDNYKIVNGIAEPDKFQIYKTSQKVVYRDNTVGNIYAGYSLLPIREAMFKNRVTIAITSVILFIIATFFVNIIGRYSLRSLSDITKTARIISHKNLNVRADVPSGEIGELASAFNSMLEDLQKSRNELEAWNMNLEKVVQERTNEYIIAKNKAEEMNRVKSIFFANMSHELRTPLIGILGFTEILKTELSNTGHIEMIDIIARSGQRLGETLNQILELSKIESENLTVNLYPHNISNISENAMKIFSSAAMLKNLQLLSVHKSENCIALVDERHFITILENLFNNAIKYTHSGSIMVETGIEISDDHKWVYCRVTDTGIGISSDKIDTIFEEFRQASEGFDRKYEGTGLGLTITKRLTNLMNGSIAVSSVLGAGSTFTVKFPAHPV
jgi:signal transduction histidine kinase